MFSFTSIVQSPRTIFSLFLKGCRILVTEKNAFENLESRSRTHPKNALARPYIGAQNRDFPAARPPRLQIGKTGNSHPPPRVTLGDIGAQQSQVRHCKRAGSELRLIRTDTGPASRSCTFPPSRWLPEIPTGYRQCPVRTPKRSATPPPPHQPTRLYAETWD